MVVCIATDSFPPALGGIATFYDNLVKLLTHNGDHAIVLMVDVKANSNDEDLIVAERSFTKIILRKTYVEYYNYYTQFFRPGGLNAPYWLAMGFAMRKWLLQNHEHFKIDVIDVIDYGGLGVFLIDPALPPVTITGHGTITQYYRINYVKHDAHFKLLVELERLSFKYADSVIGYSPLNQSDLEKTFHREIRFSDPPWVVEHLNDTSTNGKPLTVASIQQVKGTELLCEALSIIRKEIPSFQCEWIGPDFYTAPKGGSMASFLQKKFPDIWMHNFLWKGESERIDTIHQIANSKFIIVPSVFETFNYVSLEAASLRKAIIITKGAGSHYLFTHNENAVVVKTDASELADAIVKLNNQPELCEMLGKNAEKVIGDVYNNNRVYDERIHHYLMTIDERKKRNGIQPDLSFVETYTTAFRKNYYKARAFIKKIVKPSSSAQSF